MRALKEENAKFKELGLTAEEKQNLEVQLAIAQSEASFNLRENIKIKKDFSEATKKIKEVADRAKVAEDEASSLKSKLQDEHRKFEELKEKWASSEASLKAT